MATAVLDHAPAPAMLVSIVPADGFAPLCRPRRSLLPAGLAGRVLIAAAAGSAHHNLSRRFLAPEVRRRP